MADRLADAPSPYLRAHAGNPVDWWRWGPEPFAEAARRDVPVLVSIGYATCHWCHVMARESFSDPVLAAWLNDRFVAIKVDREEHAEVDAAYLAAAGAFTPNLGWPLTVFVTPRGRAFYAGTYWPPAATSGVPSFREVLEAVDDAWRNRRAEVEAQGEQLTLALASARPERSVLPHDLAPVVAWLEEREDSVHGGFGGAPKFPVVPVLRFLVDRGEPLGVRTVRAIAASGLRDPVDGGFFRYATRADWTEPHYERMLVDNAQLLAVLVLAGLDEEADGLAGFLLGTLAVSGGGLASAQDSESTVDGERVEGFYYTLDAASRARLSAPPLDEKVVTGWNGLAIGSLALAARLRNRPEWAAAAASIAEHLLDAHRNGDRLIRVRLHGVASDAPATLEDYGMLARGLLELALSTGEVRWAVEARALVDACLDAGAVSGDPAAVPGGGDPVLAGQGLTLAEAASDGAAPSGPVALADAALLLHRLTGESHYRAAAEGVAATVASAAVAHPISSGAALGLMDALARPARQLVVVGEPGPLTERARRERRGIVVTATAAQAAAWAADGFELFAGRTNAALETASLCEDFVCRLPVTEVSALDAQLAHAPLGGTP